MNDLAALVGWGMILWRLPRIRLHSAEARYTFATLVCFTLAATFSTSVVMPWLDNHTQLPAFSLVTEYAFGIAAAAAWAMSCLSLDLSLQRRRWLVLLAPVALLGLVVIWWLYLPELSAVRGPTENGEILVTTLAQGYAFSIVALIAVPALSHRVSNERSISVRLRLLCILSTQIILACWLGARTVIGPLVLSGLVPRTYTFSFVNVLIAFMILAYMSSLLPPSVFERLARGLVRVRDWLTLRHLRRVERQVAHALGDTPVAVPWAEAVSTPDYATYRVAIAILDRRKALRSSSNQRAQRLAIRLDQLVAEAPGYPDLVVRLQQMARQ